MDNLPKDPPDDNGNNPTFPAFGSNFNPHANPVDPDNPYSSQSPQDPVPEVPNPPNPPNPLTGNNTVDPVQSWVAQHQKRDENGQFVKSEHLTNDQLPQATSNNPATPLTNGNNSILPGINITENTKYSEKKDPPLVNANISVTNPVTYLKKWVYKFLKNQDIDIHLKIKPFATIGLILAFTTVSGVSFNIGRMFFPNSSPILHRAITLQGNVQMSESGQYYLSLPDNTLWTLRPKTNNINLSNVLNKQVLVKGNMIAEANVVEVAEVIAFDKPIPVINTPTQPTATNSGKPLSY